ncbi:MAG: hypothetical protein ICV83_09345 [Cytophagales bacterium]|nr:hypothetical protein [Cytophagales bacterium]
MKKQKLKSIALTLILFHGITFSMAQQLHDVVMDREPLVLQAVGSFYVGGEPEVQSRTDMGGFFPEGRVTVNQMYVNFMVPQKRKDSTSFVLIHGMTLSGKTYETTPDGRMGWNEYLVRKGYPIYVVDQVGIGRSGFNQKIYNRVRNKETAPEQQPAIIRISDENTGLNFRFTTPDGKPVADAKFPPKAFGAFSKQSIPFTAGTVPSPNPTIKNLATLAAGLKQTVLVSHSQSGSFPVETALLGTEGIKALVLVEPGGTGAGYTDEQLRALQKIPVLIVYGDNLEMETGVAGHSWKASYEGWNKFAERLKAAGGTAKMLFLPQSGMRGNSHMLMMDTNNGQIADLILAWLAAPKN